jgi:polyphosphate kinase 2 (PPK2 family)
VIFDRSWYNRAGVERVMGFCTDEQVEALPQGHAAVEKAIVDSGVILLKYWLEVSPRSRRGACSRASTTAARSGSSRRWT